MAVARRARDLLRDFAHDHRLKLQLATTVERVDRASDSGWRLKTSRGSIDTPRVVTATGKYRTPVMPTWPGVQDFHGELVHSSAYRNAQPFRGRSVLVVGPAASGLEIATQIASGGGREVWVAMRTPPHLVQRQLGPLPIDLFAVLARRLPVPVVDFVGEQIRKLRICDLSEYGLDPPPDGVYTRLKRTGMVGTVDGPYVTAIKRRDIAIVAAVERFAGPDVVLADGTRLRPDVVIAATGFHRDLEPLVGHLGILTDDGDPNVHGGRTDPRAPGLCFIGFTEPFSGNLRELRLDARRIARAMARERRHAGEPQRRGARTQTFLFADLAGYSALTEAHGDEHAADVAAEFVRSVRALLDQHGAEHVKAIGDAVLVRVAHPQPGIELARRIVCDLGRRHRGLGIRVGIHTGTAVERDGDWFGSAVNVAARVAALADAGEILLTAATLTAAGADTPAGARGTQQLKNISEPVEIFALELDEHLTEQPLVIDPVCRMAVDPDHAHERTTHSGSDYLFCSAECAAAFKQAPERYASY